MKKIISVLLILCIVAAAFAADSEVTFKGMKAVDSRSPAMGGQHVADYSDYFTILRNPAGLAFAGRHNLIGQTNINIGGPLEEVYNAVSDPAQMAALQTSDGAISLATDLISQKKLNLGLEVGGPIAIGGTYKNGFGWGLFDQLYLDVSAPSMIAKSNAELDIDLILGYGKALNLGLLGEFAFGVSTDIYAQTPYMNARLNLTDALSDPMSALMNAMVLKTSAGVNVNAGLQYRFLGFLNAAVVYNSFFSAVKNNNVTVDPDNFDPMVLVDFGPELKTEVGQGTIDIGVGLDIPTSWTLGLISSMGVYADVKDVMGCMKNDPLSRNPILNVSAGAEVTLLKCISVRGGISDSYLNAGVGLRLLGLHIDASIYGKELGNEPGSTPQLNGAISIGIRH